MILNDRELRALVQSGELGVDPFETELVQPSSIDLRLDGFARAAVEATGVLDLREEPVDLSREVRFGSEGVVLDPGQVLIGQTMELLRIPGTHQGAIAQRSSLLRLGIHVSSSLINPGYAGKLPILIHNATNRRVRLYPGLPVC